MNAAPARFAFRNPLDLPRIGYAAIVANTAEGVHVEPPGQPRCFARRPPAFHDDPDSASLFGAWDELTVTHPPVFTASLRDATLVGFRSVLTRSGWLVNDLGHLTDADASGFVASLGRQPEIAGLTPLGDGVFGFDGARRPQVRLDGPVVLLTSAEPGNFGSFLYRDLPKLVNLVEVPPHWRFLLHVPGETCEQFLELAGLPMDRVIRHDLRTVYHIEQAILPGLRNPMAMADPQTRAFYDALRAKCDSGARGRRLYVSRHSVSAAKPAGRVMLNEAELIARLRPLGFDIVEPQRLTATEQIAAFASAELVVGPSGSGMFNAAFCRPGTKLIDIESEPHWIYPHCCLFASAELEYGIFEGLAAERDWSTHHKPWRVNVEALLRRIAQFAPREAPTSAGTVRSAPALWSAPPHAGEDYRAVLQRFHQAFAPETYLEIGVADGGTLKLARCPSIGIDPAFRAETPLTEGKTFCGLFQSTSDAFFKRHDPSAIFGQPIDMAFLDGMHWFEFLLRDFINVERHCRSNSIVFLHDCLPTDGHVARRDSGDMRLRELSAHPDWWAGDVWKFAAMLRKHRPDLRLVTFNAKPTGLIAVTRLDATSTILADSYFELTAEYKQQTLSEHGQAYLTSLDIVDTREHASLERLSTSFWL